MNRFTKNLVSVALTTIFAVGAAGSVAAQCSDYIIGTSSSGSTSFDCTLTGSNSSSCFYSCSCQGTASGCEQLYALNGLYAA